MGIQMRMMVGVLMLLAVHSTAIAQSSKHVGRALEATALAHEMIQGARRTMMEDPVGVEPMARTYEERLRALPPSRERTIALAKLYWMTGEAATRQLHFAVARRRLQRAHDLAEAAGDAQTLADVTVSLAALDEETGSPAMAIRGYQAAFSIFQRLDNRRSQSVTLQNLGSLYINANDLVRGERYIRQAAAIYREEPALLAIIHDTLGRIYSDTGRRRQAHAEYVMGAELAREAAMPALELQLLDSDTRVLLDMRDIEGAARANARAETLVMNGALMNDDHLAVSALLAIAKGDLDTARQFIDRAVAMLRGRDPVLGDGSLHDMAYLTYKALGDTRAALAHQELAIRLKDQAVKATLDAQNALLGAQFDYASQDLRIAKLNSERLTRETQSQRDTLAWTSATGALALTAMAVVLGMVLRGRRRVDSVNQRLERANVELELAFEEVALRGRAERQAIQLAEHDALTGLPNRRHLRGTFLRGVVEPGQEPVNVALMLIDLDRFKPINDIHGHDVGDRLLVEVADRLRALCDGRPAKPARLGGDEFVIVAELGANGSAEELAAATVRTLALPFDIDGRYLTTGASIGLSTYGRDGTEVSDLLRKADIAMYEAKRSGRNTYRLFDGQMDLRLRDRTQVEEDLRIAVQYEQIDVYYQPIHCFEKDRTTSFEALARWAHPLRGPVSPDEFIPIAEDLGIIAALTDQVLRHACRAAQEWPAEVSVSVNLSPRLLSDEWIGQRVFGILAEEGFAPHRLMIEITETAVISDLAHAARVIESFRSAGIRVALDDFGKGYSSLSQLHELAFDCLKLDSSFVRTLDNADSMKISAAVSGLARAMDLPVTAEGVETAEAAQSLRELGFNFAQGYFFGRPVTAAQAKLLAWDADATAMFKTNGEDVSAEAA
jgi:diguanylate cyclase (GGDEF)-like protein